MNWVWMVVVTFFAGMGAGLGTGFAGLTILKQDGVVRRHIQPKDDD